MIAHKDNPNNGNFTTKDHMNRIRVTHKTDNWDNFISSMPIYPAESNIFKIKMIKSQAKWIMIGVCARSVFGFSAPHCNKNDSMTYFPTGSLWEQGVSKQGLPIMNIGSIVEMNVDLKNNKISWKVDESPAYSVDTPSYLHDKELFLLMVFRHVDDEVEMIFD